MAFIKGQKFTEEHLKRLSLSHKGHSPSLETRLKMSKAQKGRISPMKGRKHKDETKKKMSISIKKSKTAELRRQVSEKMKGKKSYLWKGGVTVLNKLIRRNVNYKIWREAVFKRDNWTCAKYGLIGVKLHPHHIKNFAEYPELRFSLDNGITLSEKAHKEFHKKYGYRNNNMSQLREFLANKKQI